MSALITLNVVFIENLHTYQNCAAAGWREDVMAVTDWLHFRAKRGSPIAVKPLRQRSLIQTQQVDAFPRKNVLIPSSGVLESRVPLASLGVEK
jgi:hypothetical protein